MLNRLFRKDLPLLILLFAVTAFVFSLSDYMLHEGEAALAAHAWKIAEAGPGAAYEDPQTGRADDLFLLRAKMYVYLSAGLVKLFGFGTGIMRVLPILASSMLLYSLIAYLKKYGTADVFQKALVAALMLCTPAFFIYAKVALPVSVTTLWGFLSFFLIRKYSESGETRDAALSGVFAGLAVLTGLTGMVFFLAGLTLLLIYRKWQGVSAYTSLFLLMLLPCAIEIYFFPEAMREKYTQLWIGTAHSVYIPLVNLAREPARFFGDPASGMAVAAFLVVLVADRKRILAEERISACYALLLFLFTGLVISGKSAMYIVYCLPHMVLIVAGAHRSSTLKKRYAVPICLLLACWYGFGAAAMLNDAQKKQRIADVNTRIGMHIPRDASVLGPAGLIYAQPGRLNVTADDILRKLSGGRPAIDNAVAFMRRNDISWLVISRYTPRGNKLADMASREYFLSKFRVVVEKPGYQVYELK